MVYEYLIIIGSTENSSSNVRLGRIIMENKEHNKVNGLTLQELPSK